MNVLVETPDDEAAMKRIDALREEYVELYESSAAIALDETTAQVAKVRKKLKKQLAEAEAEIARLNGPSHAGLTGKPGHHRADAPRGASHPADARWSPESTRAVPLSLDLPTTRASTRRSSPQERRRASPSWRRRPTPTSTWSASCSARPTARRPLREATGPDSAPLGRARLTGTRRDVLVDRVSPWLTTSRSPPRSSGQRDARRRHAGAGAHRRV